MKRIARLASLVTLLVGCAGFAAAQGYDLLSTGNGTQDNLSSIGLGVVTFQGVALPSSAGVGTADTIVWRENPIPAPGGYINIQIVALHLKNSNTVTCSNSTKCGSYYGKSVDVHATINQTGGVIPTSALPQPDSLTPSTGVMQVYTGTFNTNSLSIQADLVVLPAGGTLGTTTPVFSTPMPSDTMSSSGSQWTTTEPPGYPTSTSFPAGGFYVNTTGSPHVFAGLTGGAIRNLLYGMGLLLFSIAVVKIRYGVTSGRINMRPAYLLALAAIAWFVGWKTNSFTNPMIAQAKAMCMPHSQSVWVNEGGFWVVHVIQTAGCSLLSTTTTTSTSAQ